jgi:hypothetical protein
MKAELEVKFTVIVDSENITMEGLSSHCKSINKLSEIFNIPSVDRDSIKLESIKVK